MHAHKRIGTADVGALVHEGHDLAVDAGTVGLDGRQGQAGVEGAALGDGKEADGIQGDEVVAQKREQLAKRRGPRRVDGLKQAKPARGSRTGFEERLGLADACGELAAYADSRDAHFAIEPGPETSLTLKRFLDSLHSTGVAVNLDPANFVMVTGDDPVQAVYNLKDYIVHTHAKDGVKLHDSNPEAVYGLVREDALVTDAAFLEVPLGEGGVPFDRYLAALDDIGYKGFLTIEREVGDSPVADIHRAVDFLKEKIG